MTSLLPIYEEGCEASHVTPNSALRTYCAASSITDPPHVLSLSTNLLGPRGLQALFPVWRVCRHTLHTLDLSYNNLDNAAIRNLALWLLTATDDGFSALRRLELRGNPFTYQAGKSLVHCCEGLRPAAGASSVGGTDASTSSGSYWEDVPGMQVDYVGVEETLMPAGLLAALQKRIAEAIAHRELRRRRHRPSAARSSVAGDSKRSQRGSEAEQSKRDEDDVPSSFSAPAVAPPASAYSPAALFDELDSGVVEVELQSAPPPPPEPTVETHAPQHNSNEVFTVDEEAERDEAQVDTSGEDNAASSKTEVPHIRGGQDSTATNSSFSHDDSEAFSSHLSMSYPTSRVDTEHTVRPPHRLSTSSNRVGAASVSVSGVGGRGGSSSLARRDEDEGAEGSMGSALHSVMDCTAPEERSVTAGSTAVPVPSPPPLPAASSPSPHYHQQQQQQQQQHVPFPVPSPPPLPKEASAQRPVMPPPPPPPPPPSSPPKTASDILDELDLTPPAGAGKAVDDEADGPPSWLDEM